MLTIFRASKTIDISVRELSSQVNNYVLNAVREILQSDKYNDVAISLDAFILARASNSVSDEPHSELQCVQFAQKTT